MKRVKRTFCYVLKNKFTNEYKEYNGPKTLKDFGPWEIVGCTGFYDETEPDDEKELGGEAV